MTDNGQNTPAPSDSSNLGNQAQGNDPNPSWPSVNTSASVDAIRNDINKGIDSKPIIIPERNNLPNERK